ncbi:MAG TPA: hypothetical protein VGI45_20820 [Terracidiphilus sp.]
MFQAGYNAFVEGFFPEQPYGNLTDATVSADSKASESHQPGPVTEDGQRR